MKPFSNIQNIWLHFGFGESRKNKRLKRMLGPSGCWCFVILLLYTGKARPTGILTDLSKEDIAEESGWITDEHYKIMPTKEIEEHVNKYIDALVKSKWLKFDNTKKEYFIPSFADNNPHLQPEYKEERSKQAAEKAYKRWGEDARKTSGYDIAEIESINETEADKKYGEDGKYPIDFKSLPNSITLNNNFFTKEKFIKLYLKTKHDPQHRARIHADIKTRQCNKCGAGFINNDTKVKECHECLQTTIGGR